MMSTIDEKLLVQGVFSLLTQVDPKNPSRCYNIPTSIRFFVRPAREGDPFLEIDFTYDFSLCALLLDGFYMTLSVGSNGECGRTKVEYPPKRRRLPQL